MIIRWNDGTIKSHRARYQSAGFVRVYFGKGLSEVILFSPTFSILGNGATSSIFLNKGKTNISLDSEGETQFKIKRRE